MSTNVLYDHPGPKAKIRNTVLSVIFGIGLLGLLYYVYRAFDRNNVWTAANWKPFLQGSTWTDYLLPGLEQTLSAAAVAMLLALVFGLVFSVLRLSENRFVSGPAGAIVEFFRAVPVLLMIFFLAYGGFYVFGEAVPAFWSVVIGLTLYNGSVLAEAFRAGIRAVPKGQSEAAYSLGLQRLSVMRYILLPQAARSMLPVIVSQLVVVVKDTALGYIIAFPELMQMGSVESANFGNVVPMYMVVAAIFIVINGSLTMLAHWLDKRTGVKRARGKVTAPLLPSNLGRP